MQRRIGKTTAMLSISLGLFFIIFSNSILAVISCATSALIPVYYKVVFFANADTPSIESAEVLPAILGNDYIIRNDTSSFRIGSDMIANKTPIDLAA